MALNWFGYQGVSPAYGGPQPNNAGTAGVIREAKSSYPKQNSGQQQGIDPLTAAMGMGAIAKAAGAEPAGDFANFTWENVDNIQNAIPGWFGDAGADSAMSAAEKEILANGLRDMGVGESSLAAEGLVSAAPEAAAETALEEAAGTGLTEGLGSTLSGWAAPLGVGALGGLLLSRWF